MNVKGQSTRKPQPVGLTGVASAACILGCWALITGCLLKLQNVFYCILAIPVLSHLYTGLFITAHDAMHGTVHANRQLNDFIGALCSFLFVFNSYDDMKPLHLAHHRYVATDKDPDYLVTSADFWPWFIKFFSMYANRRQFLLITLFYCLLRPFFTGPILVLSWILPATCATFQLFYFGTYIPHGLGTNGQRADNKHRSHTQECNHLKAFLTCYFFGYHFEHHDQPWLPWWRLWQAKDMAESGDATIESATSTTTSS